MTVWAYYRVSTDDQTVESQRVGVVEYATRNGLSIDRDIIDDGVSGTVLAKDRNLNKIIKQAKSGDKVIVSELSRLGRSTADVINTCQIFIKKNISCYFIKQNMSLDNSPMGKMMVAILSAFAEMERDLISQRTKEGLARVKLSGRTLGRPKGIKNIHHKLEDKEQEIIELINKGWVCNWIAKRFNCSNTCLKNFCYERKIYFYNRPQLSQEQAAEIRKELGYKGRKFKAKRTIPEDANIKKVQVSKNKKSIKITW